MQAVLRATAGPTGAAQRQGSRSRASRAMAAPRAAAAQQQQQEAPQQDRRAVLAALVAAGAALAAPQVRAG